MRRYTTNAAIHLHHRKRATLEWRSGIGIGYPVIDAQHRKLINILNRVTAGTHLTLRGNASAAHRRGRRRIAPDAHRLPEKYAGFLALIRPYPAGAHC